MIVELRTGGRRSAKAPAWVGALLLLSALVCSPAAGALPARPAPPPALAGRRLSEALRLLQEQGWPVVFSSRLVLDSMRVAAEPSGDGRRALLADLLRPHGLAVREGAHDRLVVVAGVAPAKSKGTEAAKNAAPPPDRNTPATAVATTELPPGSAASVEEEIVVTPGRDTRRGSSVVQFGVDANDADSPRLVADALAAAAVVPGASSVEGSGQISVRGGDGDDVLVMLDGLELVRPYHLADFDRAVSFVDPSAVDRAEVFTGPYPAQYGDRMGGVVDLTTRSPTRRHLSLGLDALGGEGAISDLLGQRARWLATGRTGSYQWPLERSGLDEHPRYWDSFGKLEVDLSPSHTVVADALVARDSFELSSEHRSGDQTYDSSWNSSYAWIRDSTVLSRDLYVATLIGTGDIDHVRSGGATTTNDFTARDRRALTSLSARQDWHWEMGPLGALEWGFDYERSTTTLDFSSRGDLEGLLLATPGASSLVARGVSERFDATNVAAYASTQLHPARRLSLDIGLRHDTVTLSDEDHLSPRLAATWEPGPKTVVRAAWGWFYQSQRPYELQLGEGDGGAIASFGSERAEHQDLSFERQLAHGMMIELAAYRRRLEAPRVRFENLFDPVLVFPELAEDRVRVAPERGSAEGIELTLRQVRRGRMGWWATYTESSVVDEIDGRRVPRSTDQPHSFRAGLDYHPGREWDLALVWQYHSGWPTTALAAHQVESADGTAQWVPVPGPRNAERLPSYHRLDLRFGRSWSLGLGRLEAHVDLLDVYDRENLRGFENIQLVPDGAGGVDLTREPVTWRGFVPSVGVRWSF